MLRVVVGLPIAGEDDAGRAIKLALALVDTLDGIGSDVEPELRLALAVQRGVAHASSRRGRQVRAARSTSRSRRRRSRTSSRARRAAPRSSSVAACSAPRAPSGTSRRCPRSTCPTRARSAGSKTVAADEDTDPGVKRARVYRLRGPKERAQRLRERRDAERLHGRDLELKALRDAWRDVLVTRRKRQIVIVGDAGVGKRTLVRTFLDGISRRARRW